MSSLKPLIFVHPLSETLKKLFEVMQESAESEGIELYEIDDIGEFNQLFPTIGQSVAIFGDPKKCAKGLQSNKKTIQKIHSKVILLSNKAIPRKTLEKFDKVGLTECIIEPVVPKTLLYKVKLHLRSIISKEEQEEQSKSFSKSDDKNNEDENDSSTKTFSSKEEKKNNEEHLDYRRKSKKNQGGDEDDQRESSYHDEEIDTHWKGKNKVLDDSVWDESEDKKKNKYQEQTLDGYYKGKVKKGSDLEFEDEETSQKQRDEDFLDDEINDLKKDLLLEVEEDMAKTRPNQTADDEEDDISKKKNKPVLEAIEDDKKSPQTKVDQIDSYLKGKSSSQEAGEQNAAADSARDRINNDPMRGEVSDLYQEQEDEVTKARGEKSFDLVQEEKEKAQKKQADAIDGNMVHDGELIKETPSENLEDHKKRKAEEIEKYIKGSLSHQAKLEDENEIIDNEEDLIVDIEPDEDIIKRTELALDKEVTKKASEDTTQADEFDDLDYAATKTKLDLEKEKSDRRSNYQDKESASIQTGEGSTDQIDHGQTSKTQYEEGDIDQKYSHQSDQPQDKNIDPGHLSGEARREKENKKKSQLADNHAEKIQKYYKGVGNSHKQEEWGNHKRNASSADLEFEKEDLEQQDELSEDWDNQASELQYGEEQKKKNSGEFVQNQKEKGNSGELIYNETALGEQTIDYKKLKEEFEAIPYDLKGKGHKFGDYQPNAKDTGYSFESEGAAKGPAQDIDPAAAGSSQQLDHDFNDPFLKDLPPDLIAQKLEEKEQREQEQQLFEPRPQGLHHVIALSQKYLSKDENFRQRLEFAAQNIKDQYQGHVAFYLRKPETNFFEEVFVSYFDLGVQDSSEAQLQSWSSLKEIKFPFWLQMTLPTWSDNTFQDQDCDYFFPFTQNQIKLGFAVVHFTQGFRPEKSAHLEVYLDAIRGIFMEPHQKFSPGETKTKKEEKEARGFLGKFFKDKAS